MRKGFLFKKIFLLFSIIFLTTAMTISGIDLGRRNFFSNSRNQISYNQLYVLGDSLSDMGALVGSMCQYFEELTGIHCDSFLDDPFYQHRSFSNGKVAVNILAEKLGLKLTAAWDFYLGLNRKLQQVGNNYAFAGGQASVDVKQEKGKKAAALKKEQEELEKAGFEVVGSEIRSTTTSTKKLTLKGIEKTIRRRLLKNVTIDKQADALLEQHKIKNNDLIFLGIGSNDLMSDAIDYSLEIQEKVIANAISNQKKTLEKLIANNAQHIIIMNSPDLSKIPQYNDSAKKDIASAVSKKYNEAWKTAISPFEKTKKVKIFDLYQEFDQLLNLFAQKEINVKTGALKYKFNIFEIIAKGKFTPTYNKSVTPKTIDENFFFDFVHPTKPVHEKVGEMLFKLSQEKWD